MVSEIPLYWAHCCMGVSHKVFTTSFCRSELANKFVNWIFSIS